MHKNKLYNRGPLFYFKTEQPKAKDGEIFIYGHIVNTVIYPGEIGTAEVLSQLESLTDREEISVRINSPGGFAFEGLAIYNALNRHPAKVNVFVDALAASAASIVAMAGDKIFVAENASIMIHKPWGKVIGTSEDMLKQAEVLENLCNSLAVTYASRTKIPEEKIKDMMSAETWMSAEEAIQEGFAEEIVELKEKPKSEGDLNIYANAPEWVKQQFSSKSQDIDINAARKKFFDEEIKPFMQDFQDQKQKLGEPDNETEMQKKRLELAELTLI